jgi:chaperonin GroES
MQPKTLVLNKIPVVRSRANTITTELGDYEVAEFSGRNESGYHPVGDHVLILPDQPANTDSALIRLPDDVLEKIALAAVTGVVVALGDGAYFWNSDRTRRYEGEKIKVGQRIYFERYAGQKAFGRDRKWYRCLSDKCIACVCID